MDCTITQSGRSREQHSVDSLSALTWCRSHYSGFLPSAHHYSADGAQKSFSDTAVACCPRKWEYPMRSQAKRRDQMLGYRWEHCAKSTWVHFYSTNSHFSLCVEITLKLSFCYLDFYVLILLFQTQRILLCTQSIYISVKFFSSLKEERLNIRSM